MDRIAIAGQPPGAMFVVADKTGVSRHTIVVVNPNEAVAAITSTSQSVGKEPQLWRIVAAMLGQETTADFGVVAKGHGILLHNVGDENNRLITRPVASIISINDAEEAKRIMNEAQANLEARRALENAKTHQLEGGLDIPL